MFGSHLSQKPFLRCYIVKPWLINPHFHGTCVSERAGKWQVIEEDISKLLREKDSFHTKKYLNA